MWSSDSKIRLSIVLWKDLIDYFTCILTNNPYITKTKETNKNKNKQQKTKNKTQQQQQKQAKKQKNKTKQTKTKNKKTKKQTKQDKAKQLNVWSSRDRGLFYSQHHS